MLHTPQEERLLRSVFLEILKLLKQLGNTLAFQDGNIDLISETQDRFAVCGAPKVRREISYLLDVEFKSRRLSRVLLWLGL